MGDGTRSRQKRDHDELPGALGRSPEPTAIHPLQQLQRQAGNAAVASVVQRQLTKHHAPTAPAVAQGNWLATGILDLAGLAVEAREAKLTELKEQIAQRNLTDLAVTDEAAVHDLAIQVAALPDATGLAAVLPKARSLRADCWDAGEGGHSIGRHGPQLTDAQLGHRLTHGVAADGAPTPAPGLSSKFLSAELWVEARQTANDRLKAGLNATITAINPTFKAWAKARRRWDTELTGRMNAAKAAVDNQQKGKAANDAKTAFKAELDLTGKAKAVQDVLVAIPNPAIDQASVKFNPDVADADKAVTFKSGYSIVVDHGKPMGSGIEGINPHKATYPADAPHHKKGAEFDAHDVSPGPAVPLTLTRTTLVPPDAATALRGAVLSSFRAAQHFPTRNEPVGIEV